MTATYDVHSPSAARPRRRALRGVFGAVPKAAWVCAAIAFLNATAWALLNPFMLVPDEPSHVYYVQQLAETGQVPNDSKPGAASQQNDAIRIYSHLDDIVFGDIGRPAWTRQEGRILERGVRESSPVGGGGGAGVGLYPPLYYATLVVPYAVTKAAGGALIEQQLAMRILSALYAGGTVLFVFLFLRELLPRTPWAWRVGALAVALHPLFGFISGGVSPDSLLTLFCTATIYLLARAFRRGLTPRLGGLIGLTLALATLAKLAALGLLPGVVVAGAILVWRAGPDRRRQALLGVGAGAVAFTAPMLLYLLLSNTVWHRPLLGGAGETVSSGASGGGGGGGGGSGSAPAAPPVHWSSLSGYLSYTWQLVFPPLPFMHDWLPGFLPNEIWFRGWVGRFGWGGLVFPGSVYSIALGVFSAVVALVAASLVRLRASLRRRLPELGAYVALLAGLICFYGYVGYHYFLDTGAEFEQARYLFPLIALYGALVAVAVAGLGRRLGVAVGATLVVLAFGHDVASLVLNVGHYYT
jgi:4-amino-4-deoxy-L-arabinose transferase-like glycosyltransferase